MAHSLAHRILNPFGVIFGGMADPRLSAEENARAQNQGVLDAGLSILAAEPGTPSAQAISQGALAGRQSGRARREEARLRASREQIAALGEAGVDLPQLRQMLVAAVGAGDMQTAGFIANIIPAMIASSSQAATKASFVRTEDAQGNPVQVPFNPVTREVFWDEAIPDQERQPLVNIQEPKQIQETARNKYWGERYGTFMEAGIASAEMEQRLNQLEGLLQQPGVYQGTAGDAILSIKRLGTSLGANIEGVAPSEAARSLGRQLALEFRNPASGAGMPGQLSDKDREYLESIVPGLAQTPAGNQLILQVLRALARRRQEVAAFVDQYAADHGGVLDGGILNAIRDRFGSSDERDATRGLPDPSSVRRNRFIRDQR